MIDAARVLVIVAHPDDAELAMGMRLRHHVEAGSAVSVHCLSSGARTDGAQFPPVLRATEARRAGEVLGVAQYTFSAVPDAEFADHRGQINRELLAVLRAGRPDLVYTHYPHDQHLDHQVAGAEVTALALREAAGLIYFRSPYSVGFQPNLVHFASSGQAHMKLTALRCFSSQSQLDMDVFDRIARVEHHLHVHHRVLERLVPDPSALRSELFHVHRLIERS